MKAKWLMPVCLSMAVLVAVGCAPTEAPPKSEVPAGYGTIRLVGGTLGGSHATTATALSVLLNKYYPEIEWSSSSGALATNVIYITKGSMKLGTVLPGGYLAAYGFDKIPESRLRSIIHPTSPSESFFLIPEDKPWKDITQVPKGLTLGPGAPGELSYLVCEAWLKLVGLSNKDFNVIPLGKSEFADAWRAGKLDFAFQGLIGMAPFLADMHSSPRKIKAMGLSPEQAAKAIAEQTFERIGTGAPSMGTLSQRVPEIFKYDVIGTSTPAFLSCRDDFPEDVAYKMARIIDEHKTELAGIYSALEYATPQNHIKWAKPPLDIHPGVAKYYREKGYLK